MLDARSTTTPDTRAGASVKPAPDAGSDVRPDTDDARAGALRDTVRDRPDDVVAVLAELSGLLVDGESVDATLRRVLDLATRTVPGTDAASLTLLTRGTPRTAVCTDPRTIALDTAQYDADDGPCLDAYRRRRINRVELGAADDRWPDFTAAARGLGVRGFLAAPLAVGDEPLGALNLYSRSPAGFDAVDEAFVGLLAGQASAAIANELRYATARALAGQLEEALASRAVIEQAKGVLMTRHGVTDDGAFRLLRRESQHRNVKLRAVAVEVVASTGPAG